jgi:anti-sigma regulatory factor (Ser/Thr protein kinase)
MNEPPNVLLALASRADNVVLVREVLAGLADTVDFGHALDDVKAAVSEACNNVVVHAYGGDEGPMEVEIRVRQGELEVVVRDHGVGIGPRGDDDDFPARGIGLAVIEALTARAELRGCTAHGLEMAMLFQLPDPGDLCDSLREYRPPARSERLGADSDVEIAIAPAALSAAILNRLVSALAARAGFSIDRLSDAQLVTDALAARIAPVLDGVYVSVGIGVRERTVELRVGRLRAGGSASLVAASAIGELGPVISRLTDEIAVSHAGRGEMLTLVMRDARTVRSSAA